MLIAHLTTVDMSLRYLVLPQLEAIVELGGRAVGISAPGEFVADIEARGIDHVALPDSTRSVDVRADLRSMVALWRILRRIRPDVLHTHTPKPGIYGRILGRLCGVPVVMNTVHGLYASEDDPTSKRLAVYGIEALAARFSDLELIQSREDFDLVRRWRITRRSRTRLLGNGIDLNRFDRSRVPESRRDEMRQELGIGPDEVVVGSVGRLVAEKGFPELFEAADRLQGKASFVVVGPSEPNKADGLSEADLARARDAGVHLVGMQTNLEEWYSAMDLFVLASHREGFPRAAMEASAMGLPVVATDIRGCREVVDDGVTGILTPVREPVGLARSIERLIESESLRSEMGSAAAEKARRDFDEKTVVEIVVSNQIRLLREKGVYPSLSTDEAEVQVRQATIEDVPTIAALHREGISTGFLPRLGPGFLGQLYEAMLEEPGSIVLVAADRYGPVAFVAGVPDVGSFYSRFFRQRGVRAAWSAGARLLRPSMVKRAVETATYEGKDDDIPAELLSTAVSPPYRGRGIAGQLSRRLLDDLAAAGIKSVKVVVAEENQAARRLYESVGFRDHDRIEVHEGEPSIVMASVR